MSTDLVVTGEMPAHIQLLKKDGGDYREDIGHLSPRDIRAPFIKLAHGNSAFMKPGWGPAGNEPPMPYGQMFFTHNFTVIPRDTTFIPLIRDVVFMEWENGEPGTKLLSFSRDPNDPKVLAGTSFRVDPNTGNQIKPTWDTYVNIYVITALNMDQPVILSFYRTALKAARKFTNQIMQATQALDIPMFSHKYKLNNVESKPDVRGNTWCSFTMTPDGFTPENLIEACQKMHKQAKFLVKASSTAEFAQELASVGDNSENAVTVNTTAGEIIQTTPAPAVTPVAAPPGQVAATAAAPAMPVVTPIVTPVVTPAPAVAPVAAVVPVAAVAAVAPAAAPKAMW